MATCRGGEADIYRTKRGCLKERETARVEEEGEEAREEEIKLDSGVCWFSVMSSTEDIKSNQERKRRRTEEGGSKKEKKQALGVDRESEKEKLIRDCIQARQSNEF